MNRLNLISILSTVMLAACSDSNNAGGGQGTLSLSVTDAVVDAADKVEIEFTSVSIKPADGPAFERSFTARQIDLLALSGGGSEGILTGEVLDAGDYVWLKLHINEANSSITIGGSQYPLNMNPQDELKLVRGFTIPNGGEASFTVDFDLRKSVVEAPPGNYKLKPVLRIVDDTMVGTLTGTIDATLLANECTDAGVYAGAVYLYDAAATTADDIDPEPDLDGNAGPVSSGIVDINNGSYTVAFLEAGDYQVSYTCQADLDLPGSDDSLLMTFSPLLPVTIVADTVKLQDIGP